MHCTVPCGPTPKACTKFCHAWKHAPELLKVVLSLRLPLVSCKRLGVPFWSSILMLEEVALSSCEGHAPTVSEAGTDCIVLALRFPTSTS